MVKNPPENTQRVIPYLLYRDAAAAIDFLVTAFGFEERFRMPDDSGRIMHAELGLQDNILMLSTATAELGHASPKDLPAVHTLVCCYVDDVDAHFANAKKHGAEITREVKDEFYGDRTYQAKDPEGHHWSFHTHVRDVSMEEVMQHSA